MDLLKKVIILYSNLKNKKKSIWENCLKLTGRNSASDQESGAGQAAKRLYTANRTEIFLIIALLVFIIVPLILNISPGKEEPLVRQVNLYLSPRWEEFFSSETTEELLNEFNKKNSDIQIRLFNANSEAPAESSNGISVNKRFAYTSARRSADSEIEVSEPDIYIFDSSSLSSLLAAGSLTELNSFLKRELELLEQDEHYQELNEQHLDDTRHFALPLVSFMYMLFYNIDILAAAGFDHPPRTREEFISYTRAVTRGNFNAAGAALSLSKEDRQALSRDIFSWIWSSGGNFWTDGDKPVLNTRAIVNDFTFFGTLIRENILAPQIFQTTGKQRLEEFAAGQLAMMIASTQVIPYLREQMGDSTFGITTIPDAGRGGVYSKGISSISAGINAGSEYPDEAWRFLHFLAEKSLQLCAELSAVPGLAANILPGDYIRNDPFYSKAWDIFEVSRIAEGFSGNPNAHEYETAFLEELQTFFETNRTAQQAVTAIQQRWDGIESN